MFSNMKISVRLSLSFGIILIFTILVALFAGFQTYTLIKLKMQLDNPPVIVSNAVRDININLVKIQDSIKTITLIKYSADLKAFEQTIKSYETKISQDFETIEKHFLADKRYFDKVIRLFEQWQSIIHEIIASYKKGKVDKTVYLITSRADQQIVKLKNALEQLTRFIDQKTGQDLKTSYSYLSQSLWIGFFMILAIILGGGFAMIISRNLAQTLNVALEIADAVAIGDVSERIKCDGTESGELLKALDTLQDQLRESIQNVESLEAELYTLKKEKRVVEEEKRMAEKDKFLAEKSLRAEQALDKVFSTFFSEGDGDELTDDDEGYYEADYY
jgi:methyl-accepting chemotaxis protein